MKRRLLVAALVVAASLLGGLNAPGVSAHQDSRPLDDARGRTWSIAVHIRYPDGFIYDGIFRRGVSTAEMASVLADCGAAHYVGSAVPYHCDPIPE